MGTVHNAGQVDETRNDLILKWVVTQGALSAVWTRVLAGWLRGLVRPATMCVPVLPAGSPKEALQERVTALSGTSALFRLVQSKYALVHEWWLSGTD